MRTHNAPRETDGLRKFPSIGVCAVSSRQRYLRRTLLSNLSYLLLYLLRTAADAAIDSGRGGELGVRIKKDREHIRRILFNR